MLRRCWLGLCLLLLALVPANARAADAERAAAKLFERLKDRPPALRVFLQALPKGGDLHNHLDGSVYAEDYLKWADADGFCLAKDTKALSPPPCTAKQVSAKGLAERNPLFYQAAIDALSLRSFAPGTGTGEATAHDHGFATFGRFIPLFNRHMGEALAVSREQAARDPVTYAVRRADRARHG